MTKITCSLLAAVSLCSLTAEATPINLGGSEANLQQIVDDMTYSGTSSVDVINDQFPYDQVWTMSRINGIASAMITLEISSFASANRFGVYDALDPSRRVELFSGAQSSGAMTSFSVHEDGRVYRNSLDSGLNFSTSSFGFYLETPVGLWYSENDRNADGFEHVLTYQGEGDWISSPLGYAIPWTSSLYLLAWEDAHGQTWDQDYNDFLVLVGGIAVPEPTSLGLFGLGLLGLLGLGWTRHRLQNSGSA